jgi:hypothetical protein
MSLSRRAPAIRFGFSVPCILCPHRIETSSNADRWRWGWTWTWRRRAQMGMARARILMSTMEVENEIATAHPRISV